ncbi:MAG: DUF2271 domain-containing protein [Sporomusaceae bacterium]|jgi:hypothetical protein|nr:DUF2271 domain-containing protein [Sporomusaceae bacterium]
MRKYLAIIVAAFIVISVYSFTGEPADNGQAKAAVAANSPGDVVIEFDYQSQAGYASNQFAVWIEDEGGNLVKTLYATRYTANGGYERRPDSIPYWVKKSGLATMEKTQVDAFSGATPRSGTLAYAWDLKDTNGDQVAPGKYNFLVEGSLRWKNRVLYTGTITVGDSPNTTNAKSEFFYQGRYNQPSLTGNSVENAMISNVRAKFNPLSSK